jgi:hypothetical protein
MARVMKGRLAKLIAQVATLALVIVGLVALVSTQRGAEATASADDAAPASASGADDADSGSLGSTVLNLERASQVDVVLPKAVTVKSGTFERAFATDAATVEQALRQGKVDFDGNDRLSPAGDTPVTSGMTVTVQRVDTATTTTAKAVPFETVKVQDEDLARGKTEVVAEGRAGKQVTTWTVTTVDGKVTGRKATATETVREPVDRRIAVGTKAPAPKPAPRQVAQPTRSEAAASAPSSSSAARPSAPRETTPAPRPEPASAPASGAWQALAECESGGNWSINTGNGYYGGLQFSASSWAGAGGTRYAPLPHQATPAEQIATAEVLRANGGWGHWPACSSKLGLR